MIEGFVVLLPILTCLLFQGFFSGSEMAFVSSRWGRLKREAEKGDKRAALLLRLWKTPDRLLATTLVGTNLSVIISSVLSTSLAVDMVKGRSHLFPFLVGREEFLVVLCLSPLTLVFGEIIPKTVFQAGAERMAKRVAYPMALMGFLFYPLTAVLTLFSGLIKRIVPIQVEASPFVTREELAMVVRLRDLKTDLKKHEQRMIRRLFSFRETTAGEIMVPLVRVVAHEESASLSQALRTFANVRYTRYPVYRKRMFNVVGVLNILDCRHESNTQKKVNRLMEPAMFVPAGKSIADLLRDMEKDRKRMAVVVDEYGGAVGIVTREDILEEIVGELEGEYEIKKSGIKRLDAGRYEVDAHLGLEMLAETLGLAFPAGDYETLAGLMIQRLGRIPKRGDEVKLDGLSLTAESVSRRTVERIIIGTKPEKT